MTTTYTKIITIKVEYEDQEVVQEILDILESIECEILFQEQGIDKIDGVPQVKLPTNWRTKNES